MMEITNILVCSDFTPNSDLALRAAEIFRKKTNAKVHALHVSEFPVEWNGSLTNDVLPHYLDNRFDLELLESSRKQFKREIEKVGLECEAHVSMGLAYNVIHQMIEDKKINLLIMGHKGKESTPFRLGSLTEKMVASSSVPLLILNSPFQVDKIGALYDPMNPFPEVLSVAQDLAQLFSTRLEIVSLFCDISSHFVGMGRRAYSTKLLALNEEERQEIIHDVSSEIRTHLPPDSDAVVKVEISVEKKQAFHLNSILAADFVDLAVMKRHHAGFLEKLIIGSETRRMLEIYNRNFFILV